jgi:hypothetical protein
MKTVLNIVSMKKAALIIIAGILIASCTDKKVGGVYRYNMGKLDNYDIWIVNGNQVRLKIFSSYSCT